jgi:hypothetical protein
MPGHGSNDFEWRVGTDGNVYTEEKGGELVAAVAHGSPELARHVFREKTTIDGNPPSLKPCRARMIAATPAMLRELCKVEEYLADLCDFGVADGHPAYRLWLSIEAVIVKATGQPTPQSQRAP